MVAHRDIQDAELGGHFTVKVYESEKEPSGHGEWRHKTVTLKPDSNDPRFEPIILSDLEEGKLRIVAEMVEVLDGCP